MRILARNDVRKAKALDQQREIEQGKALAQKVDDLRQLTADTEAGYEKYRVEQLRAIQADIDSKLKEREDIEAEVSAKRAEWRKMFEPLDKQFALYVKTERGEIDEEKRTLAAIRASLEARDTALQEHSEELDTREHALQERAIDLERDKQRIEKLEADTDEELARARNEAHTVRIRADRHEQETLRLRAAAAEKLKELELKEAKLAAFAVELEERETAVIIKELEFYSPVKKS